MPESASSNNESRDTRITHWLRCLEHVNEAVDVPQSVLYWRCGQHEDEAGTVLSHQRQELLGNLRRLILAVQISQSVRFVEEPRSIGLRLSYAF